MLFNDVNSLEEYRKTYQDDTVFLPGIRAICSRHNFDHDTLQRAGLGSNVVFWVDGAIIKVFCNLWPQDFMAERAALQSVSKLPVPSILAEGQIDHWPYLVLSVLDGTPIGEIWDDFHGEQKADVLRQLGILIRTLHAQKPVAELKDNWANFIDERVNSADAHHAMEEPWKSWIRNRLTEPIPTVEAPVLLHADITNEHVLLIKENDHWVINGLIDFGDAKVGHPLYDFLAPIAGLTFGEPDLTRILLESYGLTLDRPTTESITTYCLLHEFGTVADFLKRHPVSNPEAFYDVLWNGS